MSADFEINN